ncbi:MAG: hypothetical protein A2007_01980 [Verrucomicrobia bacterium GWC2_42_7]|nr:MAG: hypothetical protein A2007_01980 [Verrucomicrobia bacterium GWC2_42_7]
MVELPETFLFNANAVGETAFSRLKAFPRTPSEKEFIPREMNFFKFISLGMRVIINDVTY